MDVYAALAINPPGSSSGQVLVWGSSGLAGASSLKTINNESLLGIGNIAINAASISDFAEAVDDEVATLLQAGTDVTVTYNDAGNTLTIGLGSNVPRLNAANTFAASQTISISTTTGTLLTVGTASNANAFGVTQYSSGAGARYVWARGEGLYAQSDAGVNQASISQYGIRVASGVAFQFSSSTTNTSSIDCSILRNATGPTLETRAAGGLRVCNADGSALAAVNCGRANVSDFNAGGGTVFINQSTGRMQLYNSGMLGWTASATAETIPDTGISRVSAGVLQIGTTSNNALGSLACANVIASALVGLGVYTVATLPSASANPSRIATVTDSSVTTNGSAVAGGGSNRVLVFSNGTTWDVVVA